MKQKLVALFLVIVMVASGLTVVGLATTTTKVDALTATTTTITASKIHPAVGESVIFTVKLKAGTTGLSKTVTIWHYRNGVRYSDGTHKTVNGVYKFTQAFGSVGPRLYYAKFYGDSKYAVSYSSVTVYVGKPTTLTLEGAQITTICNKYGVIIGQKRVIFGHLKDKTTGKPITGVTVTVERLPLYGSGTWTCIGSGVTDGTGRYNVPYTYTQYHTYWYRAHFLGNALYAPSYSPRGLYDTRAQEVS